MTGRARYFSGTYGEARSRFLAAAAEAGALIGTHPHHLRGPEGETLAIDVVRLGPHPARRIIGLGSGTHGVEGFCGSGIQTALIASGMGRALPAGTALVFIHAINPWGFAWGRRVNEDNVDLNRNFLDHAKPHPENPGYEEIYDAVNPRDLGEATLDEGRTLLRAYAEKNGPAALQHALSGGQYAHPEGVQFGGLAPVWSNLALRAIIRETFGPAEHVLYIDLHSGLGPRGRGEVISTAPETSAPFRRMKAWWGDIVHSTKAAGSVSSNVPGSITEAFTEELAGREVTPCAFEFGTIPMNAVAAALVADNWLHRHGGLENALAPAIKKQIRDAFYVDEDDWKEEVTRQTDEMIRRALAD